MALEDTEGNRAVTLEEKQEMLPKAAFPHTPADPVGLLPLRNSKEYQMVDETTV